MNEEDWDNPLVRSIGVRLAGDAIAEVDRHGNRIVDDTLLALLNAHHESLPFTLPAHREDAAWELILDTGNTRGKPDAPALVAGSDSFEIGARSLSLFRLRKREE